MFLIAKFKIFKIFKIIILNNINKSTMPLLKMNLVTQSQLVYNQIQYTQQIQQRQPLVRLGSVYNRNMLPLLITGNKSCSSCGGK